ncbi:MAG: ATP-dependent zinc metalloprotease FtsH [Patescibacteria group bacterium]
MQKLQDFLKKNWLIFVLVIIIAGSAGYAQYFKTLSAPENITISELVSAVADGKVDHITVSGNTLTATLKENDEKTGKAREQIASKEERISLTQYGLTPDKVKIDIKDDSGGALWLNLITTIVPFLLVAGFLYFMLKQAQGAQSQAMSFGKSRAKLNLKNTKVTFADVAGNDEAKRDLVEIVDFLKSPKKYHDLGAEIPKGVLLLGHPGTGKTLLAKAVAGEADAPFFSISGSEFVEMFVGVGASRVRDLFIKARKAAPCIIFIDEIDAVGRRRGSGTGGGHDEREQTLNQILVELDGFDSETNIIVIAATNRPDVLDPALLRPGRFDRHVAVDLPDIKGREEILQVHAKGKPMDADVNLKSLAQKTPGFSGADLKNILNEGAILAAREDKKSIGTVDLNEAIEKVMLGPERRSKLISEQERKITAYHEAGHALVSHFLPNSDPVHKISIVSRGRALGYTWSLPETDPMLHSQEKFEDDIAMMLGGREAELIIFKQKTTGAQNDLMKANDLARKMVIEYGMSDAFGPVSFHSKDEMNYLGGRNADHRPYSDKTAEAIDAEIEKIVSTAQKKANHVLTTHSAILEAIAQHLMKEEIMEREEFEGLINQMTKKSA